MELSYLGHSCFLLKAKTTKLVTDPFGRATGFTQVETEADIVTISHNHFDHNDLSRIKGQPVVLTGPGEYEIKGVNITGIDSWHDSCQGQKRGKNTIFLIEMEEMRFCHLGDLGQLLTDSQLTQLENIDVLLVPVGGRFTLDPLSAWKTVQALNPRIVVPMHFRTELHSRDFQDLVEVAEFVKQSGLEAKKELKLSLNKLNIPEEMELVILERKN